MDEIPHRLREVEQAVVALTTASEKDFAQRRDEVVEQRKHNDAMSKSMAENNTALAIIKRDEENKKRLLRLFAVPIVGLILEGLYRMFIHT